MRPGREYLAARPEIDAKRIGRRQPWRLHAPRAAAFEPRYCCIAWGAQWDYEKIWRQLRGAWRSTPALSILTTHSWVVNATPGSGQLEPFKLDTWSKIACPFVMLHGRDEQFPGRSAEVFDAVARSRRR
jgi:hypothetical protein